MEDIKLKDIGIDEFKKDVYSYYLEIFPEDERKPIELLHSSYKKHYTRIIEILYENEVIGFMILNKVKDKGYAVLDYLAILPQYRNNKFGTKALQILLGQEKENSGIFIEIEKVGLGKDIEENLLREKRKNFYEKVGFKKLNFDLFLFDVIYTPYLFSNIKDDEDMIIDEILNIYEAISGKERIEQNCKIIKKLRFE
ncbi:MAG: GNAT family N-acetyltransferase [Clostridia bacterium]|nr:GNAT family N-acetyltransferase [Clostridia bacterium]